MLYTVQEKVGWVRQYYSGRSYREIADHFHTTFPLRPKPSHTSIVRCVRRFEATGNVTYARTGSHQNRATPASDVLIVAAVEADPRSSSRSIGEAIGKSHAQVLRTLHKHGFRSYKSSAHQELRPGDADRRLTFAMTMLEVLDEDPDFTRNIIFTDESSFKLHHRPNVQNYRIWAQENPRSVCPSHTQYPETLNVWAGIVGQHVIGPIVIDGKLTGPKYLEMLQSEISERLDALQLPGELWYQHDGCPAHNYGPALEFLHAAFPSRVIGTYETFAWPARSPDLAPLDFFLWGHISTSIYSATPFVSLDTLNDAIETCCTNLSHVNLNNVQREFRTRLEYCVAAEGDLFEHLL
jgi:hypothetical protein